MKKKYNIYKLIGLYIVVPIIIYITHQILTGFLSVNFFLSVHKSKFVIKEDRLISKNST